MLVDIDNQIDLKLDLSLKNIQLLEDYASGKVYVLHFCKKSLFWLKQNNDDKICVIISSVLLISFC